MNFEVQEHPGVARVLATGRVSLPRNWGRDDEDAAFQARRERLLFPPKGGSPCEGCWRQRSCDTGCELWRGYYIQRQKKINTYAKAAWKGQEKKGRDVFAYSHPDAVRRYEKTHPCGDCRLKKACPKPCGRYLHWYDFRLEQARKRVKNGQWRVDSGQWRVESGQCRV